MNPEIHSKRCLLFLLLLTALACPGRLPAQTQPAGCEPDRCEVILMDIEAGTDWTTNCDLVTIPAPGPGEPDMRQVCDPTFLLVRDPTCGPSGSDSNFTELTDDKSCFAGQLPCNVVGFRSFCMEATLTGDYKISNVGGSAGDLVFNLAGCTKIYRGDDIFNPLCALEEGGERIGITLPAPSDEEPMPSIKGNFDTLSMQCSLEGAEAAALFADVCAEPESFCFDALSDGFIEVTLSTGNLIAETILRGGARICAGYATFDFEVLTDLIEPNCNTCDGSPLPNGVVPVSFTLPDDGDDATTVDYEDPANYRLVIDNRNDGDNDWDQTIIPDGSGTFEFTGLPDGDFTVAVIYVPLAGDSRPDDLEACGFCLSEATVGRIAEPEIDADITDDCVPADGNPGSPVVGNGAIDLSVAGAENIGFLWDNGATTPRIENLEAGQYCVTVTYGPPVSELDPTGRCSVCLCFDVGTFSLTCDILGEPLICGGEPTSLSALPEGGSGDYSYLWSTGATTKSITVSPTETTLYEVTITDQAFNGDCFAVCSKEVTVFNPVCEITGDEEILLGEPATLTAEVPEGNGNFEYLWSTGATTPTITVFPVEQTTYSVTVTEFDDVGNPGCSFECSKTVWVTEPSCVIEGPPVLCLGQSAELTAIPPDKEGNYQFEWSTGSNQPSVTVTPTEPLTTYSVTITNVSEDGTPLYSIVCEHEIKVIEPVCVITGENEICMWKPTLLTAEVSGGTGNYRYHWSTGEKSKSITVAPMVTTTYEVTVTDIGVGNGLECSFTCDFTLLVNDLNCEISGDDRICRGESTLLTAQAGGGSGVYRYQWSTGATSPSISVSPEEDKTYRVTVTDLDESGNPVCHTVCTYDLAISNPICSIVHLQDMACEEPGAFSFTVDGGFPPYTYEVTTPDATVAAGTIGGDGELVSLDGLTPGEYSVQITDAEACTTECTADITDIDGPADFQDCLACNDKINISLDEDCAVAITLDMVAEGNLENCPGGEGLLRALEVVVYDGVYPVIDGQPRPDNVLDNCGVFTYEILLKKGYENCFSWTRCWGKVNGEDKVTTVEVKPEKVRGIYKYREHYGETRYTPYNCTDEDFDICFEDDLEEKYTYCNTFEFNYLVCDDLDSIYQNPRSYNDPAYPYFVGYPVVQDDCCGTMELVKVEDSVEEAPCEDRHGQITATIKRTFTFQNDQGFKTTAVQEICFYRPEILLPDCKVHVDLCAFESAGGDDDLLNPEHLSDLVRKGEEPLPYYYNGIGEKIHLTGHSCNLTVTYEDQAFTADCGSKFVRIWSLLDWCWDDPKSRSRFKSSENSDCYGEFEVQAGQVYAHAGKQTVTFHQQIIMDIEGEMLIENHNLEVSTGPFNCTAVVAPPAPKLNDCISADFEFELWANAPDPITGQEKYQRIGVSTDGALAGVPPGVYDLFYRMTDECGRTYNGVWENDKGEWTYDRERAGVLTVIDGTEPVAVCNDELQVSIGGPGTIQGGLARVRAEDIDEGSWDNCGPVDLQVRRAIDESCLENYAESLHHLRWPADYVIRYENGHIVYLAGKDVPAQDIRQGEPLLVQQPGGFFYSWWADAVFFTCCDISSDAVIVELQATDSAGNTNVCWLETLIEDKLPPSCEVRKQSVLCTGLDFDPTDPQQVAGRFGAAEEVVNIRDNCGAAISEEVTWTPGDCGAGLIERLFTVTDGSGRTARCTQEIKVETANDYEIVFPADDAGAECGVAPGGDLSTQSFACDLLAVHKDSTRFEASGDECFKLLITYRVINWCTYDGVRTEPMEVPRDWDEDKDLEEDNRIRVAINPAQDLLEEISGTQVVTWEQTDGDLAWIDEEDYESTDGQMPVHTAKGNTFYIEHNPGLWQYSRLVKVYDNIAPGLEVETEDLSFCAYGTSPDDCGGNINIVFTITDACTPNDTEVRSLKLDTFNEGNPQNPADAPGYTLTQIGDRSYEISGKLPVGKHTFVVSAADGCGNLAGKRIPFKVVDCKSPAPICIQRLFVDLMPVDTDGDGEVDDGMNTVTASDFVAAPAEDCSPFDTPEQVKYFVFKDEDLVNGVASISLDSLIPEHASVTFTCADEGIQLLYLVALDAAGNFDYCAVMAVVQRGVSPSPCWKGAAGSGSIAGLVSTELGVPVPEVEIALSGQSRQSVQTDDEGAYGFNSLIEGYDYSVIPNHDSDYLNGVSTYDLVLISKHILGVRPLDSPYQMIAADVNQSKSISTLDLIHIRKLILGIHTRFSNNTSWRFVDADYHFPDPKAPWAFPGLKNINDLAGEIQSDFIAVKVGDVNGSAKTGALQSVDERSIAGTFELNTADASLEAGEEYTASFTAADLAAIEGYQFTMTFDPAALELVDVIYGKAREENFGVFLSQGMITTSWNADGRQPTADSRLFSLVLRAKRAVELRDALEVNSRLTHAEAYTDAGELMDVALSFDADAVVRSGLELYQNRPNPFYGQTIIGFSLPESAEATLAIRDVNGRTIQTIHGYFKEGYNEVTLKNLDLPTGILFYTLETGQRSLTRKMIHYG